MKQYDVVTLGESLIDFIPIDDELPGKFEAIPGGAPANVACGLARLGKKVALISRVGNDPLGACIAKTIKAYGVDTEFMQYDKERPTTVTIVMPKSEDMLRYLIYRGNSADGALSFDEIPPELLASTRILHLGSLAMSSPEANKTTLKAIEAAKKHDIVISVDVNLRPNSWTSQDEMVEQSYKLVDLSDIVKMTKDECSVLNLIPRKVAETSNKIVLITGGGEGAEIYYKDFHIACKAPEVEVADVTGGGDAFTSAFLYFYLDNMKKIGMKELLASGIRFAVCAGSEAVRKNGAINSFPDLKQIQQLERAWKRD